MDNKWTAKPYIVWMMLFVLIPLFLIVYFSFTVKTPDGSILSIQNYKRFFDPLYMEIGRAHV